MLVSTLLPAVQLAVPSTTTSLGPEVAVAAQSLLGFPAGATVTLDVDKNNDGDFLDPGETGYATGTLANGHVLIRLPALPSTGTYRVRARVSDLAGNQGTSGTSSFTVNAVTTWGGATAEALTSDPVQGQSQQQLGDASVSQALDLDQSPVTGQGGSPALVYHSAYVSDKPFVQVAVPTPNNASLPSTISLGLTFDGTTAATVTYSTTGFSPGDVLTETLQASSAITTTGRYDYSVLVHVPGQTDYTVSGYTFVAAEDSSVYGAGWGLSGVDKLESFSASGSDPAGDLADRMAREAGGSTPSTTRRAARRLMIARRGTTGP